MRRKEERKKIKNQNEKMTRLHLLVESEGDDVDDVVV